MPEVVTLAAPLNPATTFRVSRLLLDWDAAHIQIVLTDQHERQHPFRYDGETATAKMVALNKANLTTKSLHRRAIEMIQDDHPELAGTITGTPD